MLGINICPEIKIVVNWKNLPDTPAFESHVIIISRVTWHFHKFMKKKRAFIFHRERNAIEEKGEGRPENKEEEPSEVENHCPS